MSKKSTSQHDQAGYIVSSHPAFALACKHKGAPARRLARQAVKAGVPPMAVLDNYGNRTPAYARR